MSALNYSFNNMGRIGTDSTDQSQRNHFNTRFSNHMLSDFFNAQPANSTIQFATNQPTMMVSGTNLGNGLNGSVVDAESFLKLKVENERPLDKLQLIQRPFITVPYLGRGSCDPTLESQLLQGEIVSDKKSVSTIMEKSFQSYSMHPIDNDMEEHVKNYSLSEFGMDTRNYKPK